VIGELHPGVLENWSIQQPAAASEIRLDAILEIDGKER
jgi:phenylalanyl-tRNA synthetase beta subunit